MKVKKFAAVVILSVIVIASAHSLGVGGQLNFSAGDIFGPGAALLLSAGSRPGSTTHFAVNWYLEKSVNIIGLTMDYDFWTLGPRTLFASLGAGIYANMMITKNDLGVIGGVRIPVGIHVTLGRRLELFGQVAPSFGVEFKPEFGLSSPFFPMALGARFWL
jgi:hypothetical protein